MIEPYYKSAKNDFLLAKGDTFRLLHEFDFKFDMIFADPLPTRLISCPTEV